MVAARPRRSWERDGSGPRWGDPGLGLRLIRPEADSFSSETESPGPVSYRGSFRSAGRPDGCGTDPREGAPTVFGPWVQCAFNLSMFSVSCNSHYDTQFAAVFIDPRAE